MAGTSRQNMPATVNQSCRPIGTGGRFPAHKLLASPTSSIYTDQRGFRRATSINATLTGLGGDCFIIDDPLKPVDAQSEPLRNGVNDWISHTLMSRLDDKAKGSIIVVMQRVHQHDLTGYLIENFPGNWTVLSLPAIALRGRDLTDRSKSVPHPTCRRSASPRPRIRRGP